jgi:hypothetical protein
VLQALPSPPLHIRLSRRNWSVNAHAAAVATRTSTAGAAHRAAVAVNNSNSSTASATAAAAAHAAEIAIPSNARAAFWSADATRLEEGAVASDIAGLPLWPQGQPEQLQSLWQDMKAALHELDQDWQVWTAWYEDRLAGRVRDEARELAYVTIEITLWDQGPAKVNAEIKRRIEDRSAALTRHQQERGHVDTIRRSPDASNSAQSLP